MSIPLRPQRSRRAALAAFAPILLVGTLAIPSCSDSNGGGQDKNSNKRMMLSSADFNKGYADGKRDAAASLIDTNGSWMWAWTKKAEYSKGYDKGWADGRQMKRLQTKAEPVKQEEEKPKPDVKPKETIEQSSRAIVKPLRKARQAVTLGNQSKGQQ